MSEKQIKVVHEGEDYVTVKYGSTEYEVSKGAGLIIRVLLKRISKARNSLLN